MKPRIRKIAFMGTAVWCCTGQGITGAGIDPKSSFDDWSRIFMGKIQNSSSTFNNYSCHHGMIVPYDKYKGRSLWETLFG